MWYDSGRILSYNRILNFVIGNRGGGKSFNAKNWCIKDFKKRGKEFVWVRRYKTEMKELKSFFNDIAFMYPDDELEVKGNKAFINKKLAGHFIALSTSQRAKSVPFPNVNKIIYDEFVIDKGSLRYLPNEAELFLELFETVARMRDDVRALFLANAISIVNPYFTYFNIKPNIDERFTYNDDVIIELFKDEGYINEKKKTRFGQLVDGTKYGQYSIENSFLRDSDDFIEPKTKNAKFYQGLVHLGITYGVWIDRQQDILYIVQNVYDKSSKNIFAITTDDHKTNTLMIDYIKRMRETRMLKYCYEHGHVRFDSQQTKKAFIEIYQRL